MNFIPAQPQHYPQIASLVRDEAEMFLVHPNGRYPLDAAQVAEIARVRSDLTVAVDDQEQVVGFANLYNVRPGEQVFIGNLVLDPGLRGQGVGQRFMRYLMGLVERKYRARPHLSVFSNNPRAMLLYARLGFQPYDVEPRQTPEGETVAFVHMRLHSPQVQLKTA